MPTLRGRLVLPGRIVDGAVTWQGARITRVQSGRVRRAQYIAPGFIDLHLWGEPAVLARTAPRGGTTAFLSTLGPLPQTQLVNRLAEWNAGRSPEQPSGSERVEGARWLGVHLEGPWVNARQGGALNVRAIRSASQHEADALWRASRGTIRLVTVAPERVSRAFVARWRTRYVAVSCGHTAATYEETRRVIQSGARAATHLWNKMGAPHQRRPGAVGACLEDPRVAVMLLADGRHLHPATVRLVHRVVGSDRLVLVTDSTQAVAVAEDAAFGLRRGQFRGHLAGTRLTMLEAVRHLVAMTRIAIADAVRAASSNPARLVGVARRMGSLGVGKNADLVVFDQRFRVLQTFVNGQVVYER